jgi:hypothetical protein
MLFVVAADAENADDGKKQVEAGDRNGGSWRRIE